MADDLEPSAKVMKALLGKLYMILMGGDATAPASTNSFIAWLAPGIPIDPNNLAYLGKGIASKNADENKALLAQAADFSRLVNLVPDASGVIGLAKQKVTFENTGDMVWTQYFNALDHSQVADQDLTPDVNAKLDKFRKLLWTTRKNIVTDAEEAVAGPVLAAWTEKQAAYDDAVLTYNNKRISAMNADNPMVVQDWAMNADTYRSKVRAADGAWVSGGYKNEVRDMTAFINQVTQRSLKLMKDDLRDQFNRGKLRDLVSDGDFWITTVLPIGFATGSGWTEFTFKQENQATYDRSETNAWDASVKVNAGLFGGSVNSKGEISDKVTNLDTKGFECSFELVQVPIVRPWFSPEFLRMKSWRIDPQYKDGPLSDGKRPPTGSFGAYSTTCIFVRNLKMNFDELHKKDSQYAQSIKNNIQASYGPFVAASAQYDRSVKENKFSSELTKDGLVVKGMQMIAMKCQLLPKAPDPDPNIPHWA
jgi:hypothetical protein